jgi:hypothetical protein
MNAPFELDSGLAPQAELGRNKLANKANRYRGPGRRWRCQSRSPSRGAFALLGSSQLQQSHRRPAAAKAVATVDPADRLVKDDHARWTSQAAANALADAEAR